MLFVFSIAVLSLNLFLFFSTSINIFLISIISQSLVYFISYYFFESYLEKKTFNLRKSDNMLFTKVRNILEETLLDKERRIEVGDKQSLEYQDILNSLDLSIVIIDYDYNIIFVNNIFKETFNLENADNLKIGLRDLSLSENLSNALKTNSKKNFEWNRLIPNDRYYDVTGFPINDFFCVAFKDITAIKNLEMVRTDFVANVSHELKTPLSSIIGYLETLLTVDDEKNRKKFISIIQDQSNRMNSLIDDLLSLSSIENKKTNENDQFCNLLNTVKIGINSLESKILKKKINVDINLDQSLLVGCPHEEFIQVVVNIVNNAVKYSKDGTKIIINAREKMNSSTLTEFVEISFKDSGIGIAEEHISRLTERFYRVDSARSKEVGGTGLGLSIVKHILTKNMGFIDIKSEVGKGSEFLITIPKHT